MSLQRIRSAVSCLQDKLKTPHPLADRRLKTDKVQLVADAEALAGRSERGSPEG